MNRLPDRFLLLRGPPMPRLPLAFLLTCLVLPLSSLACSDTPPYKSDAELIMVGATDWPWWRGPNRNGVADPKQQPPVKWSDTENVRWKTPVPGRGHGSPIVVG